jgi:2-haloacid dehalogenase
VTPKFAARSRIRAICFDVFTIFDPRSVVKVAEAIFAGDAAEICTAWRTRQFEYAWLRACAGRYVDFRTVTAEALTFVLRDRKLTLSNEQHERLVDACSELEPWPDARNALRDWKNAGLRLAPLSNYSPVMLERLVSRAGLAGMWDALISSDAARTYKPDSRAYALGPAILGIERHEIAFAAFGGWDAAGAKWFGFRTFWVNRFGVAREELSPPPDGTGPTLAELGAFIENGGTTAP